ncbi:protein FANTASTIC FOUR 3-like [Dorcoceras hygrometricum]|uniref:Protein FANTASTIC FOUR 3-like n=1 Tax=Dorcoceras hygrometricum TaxID=472368 RepID=A0A2Z7B5P0_9LAMI|nr:protein FANTASTIC FOUR 3-like [Dorcoceras hygrometricum]
MSTVVYQNLVSCFETQLKETATTVKLKFAAGTPSNLADMSTSLEYDNWGLLQTYPKEPVEKTSFFTHYSSSFSRLSAKSLELCTENLGSESGSDVGTDCSSDVSIFSSSSFSHSNLIQDPSSYSRFEFERPKQQEAKSSAITRKEGRNTTKRSDDFPPPLTSMCGPSSLQMRRRREGGRLIIDAVEAPFRNSYLQAERSDGRLRLSFLTAADSADTTTSSIADEEEEVQQQQKQSEHECGGEQAELEEIESGTEEHEGDMNYEVELDKFQRFSRCKEGGHGNKGLCWKPAFCVAT